MSKQEFIKRMEELKGLRLSGAMSRFEYNNEISAMHRSAKLAREAQQ